MIPPCLGYPRRQGLCSHFGSSPLWRFRDGEAYVAIFDCIHSMSGAIKVNQPMLILSMLETLGRQGIYSHFSFSFSNSFSFRSISPPYGPWQCVPRHIWKTATASNSTATQGGDGGDEVGRRLAFSKSWLTQNSENETKDKITEENCLLHPPVALVDFWFHLHPLLHLALFPENVA